MDGATWLVTLACVFMAGAVAGVWVVAAMMAYYESKVDDDD